MSMNLPAGAVLEPWLSRWSVLSGECDEVALAQAVVDVSEWHFPVSEFASLGYGQMVLPLRT
jgi:hypothetical protein